MTLLRVLQVLSALATIAVGLVALLRPRSIAGFTGLEARGPRGVTEIRSVLGGFFIALGLAPLLLNAPAAYRTLGIAYLVVALVRGVSMLVDRSAGRSNLISLLSEIVFGVILVL